MKYTANYNLKKPEGTDVINIDDLNDNADIIDSELKKLNTNKVDKVAGKGLSTNDFTDLLKSKLDGIEAGANKTIISNTLTSTSITQALSANQGKVLNDKINAHKAEDVHHKIAVGSFVHDGTQGKNIIVGFRPKLVIAIELTSDITALAFIYIDGMNGIFFTNTSVQYALPSNIPIFNQGFVWDRKTNNKVYYYAIG